MEEIDVYLSQFPDAKMFDESTIRKKLREYADEGLLTTEKKGRYILYRRSGDVRLPSKNVLDYFSEVLPCGVIGAFLLDRFDKSENPFTFKHHYITSAMDSEVLCTLFTAIREHRNVTLKMLSKNKDRYTESCVVPLKIMISVQNGRQYLMAYVHRFRRITSFRADNIISVTLEEISEQYDKLQETLKSMLPHIWGVSTQSRFGERLEHVEFTVHYADNEQHIRNRLEREKRCGTVEHLDNNTSRFSADVFDSLEMIPWIRTFICRITDINFSSKELEEQFKNDLKAMYTLYGLESEA